jgi:Zn-finger nucleic acid-binding protein
VSRGELDKIVERAARDAGDDDDDRWPYGPAEHDRYYHRRKSSWSELFD